METSLLKNCIKNRHIIVGYQKGVAYPYQTTPLVAIWGISSQIIDGDTYQMEDSRPVPAERPNQLPRYQITWLVVECSESSLISVQCTVQQTWHFVRIICIIYLYSSTTLYIGKRSIELLGLGGKVDKSIFPKSNSNSWDIKSWTQIVREV